MDEWVSEGIQVGGVASAMGVLGMWTGATHERMDPLGTNDLCLSSDTLLIKWSYARAGLGLEGGLNSRTCTQKSLHCLVYIIFTSARVLTFHSWYICCRLCYFLPLLVRHNLISISELSYDSVGMHERLVRLSRCFNL